MKKNITLKEMQKKMQEMSSELNSSFEAIQQGINKNISKLTLNLIQKGITLNPARMELIKIISLDGPISIFDLSKKASMDYKNTYRYVKQFKDESIVILDPDTFSKGKKVFVSINKTIFGEKKQELGFIYLINIKKDYSEIIDFPKFVQDLSKKYHPKEKITIADISRFYFYIDKLEAINKKIDVAQKNIGIKSFSDL